MSSNANVLFNANLLVLDTTVNPADYVVNRIRSLAFASIAQFYDSFFQAGTSPVAIGLPSLLIQVAWVCNLNTSNYVTVSFIPNGGSAETVVLQPSLNQGQPGGVFLYFNPSNTTGIGGISALTLSASGNNTSCEVLVAG